MSSKINLQTCEYACKSSIFQDNQLIYGKSVTYNRVYTDRPLGFDKSIPTKKSAKVQGIKGDIGLNSENEVKSNE